MKQKSEENRHPVRSPTGNVNHKINSYMSINIFLYKTNHPDVTTLQKKEQHIFFSFRFVRFVVGYLWKKK